MGISLVCFSFSTFFHSQEDTYPQRAQYPYLEDIIQFPLPPLSSSFQFFIFRRIGITLRSNGSTLHPIDQFVVLFVCSPLDLQCTVQYKGTHIKGTKSSSLPDTETRDRLIYGTCVYRERVQAQFTPNL